VLCVLTPFVFAHTYFYGITDLSLNRTSKKIEIIHQLTAHDLENAIAETKQVNFSPEHEKYEAFIRSYVEDNFSLEHSGKPLILNWVGFEIKQGQAFIYQDVLFENFLVGLLVKNELLVNTYAKQVNILNFQGSQTKGSLTFNTLQKAIIIE
jgi:hypothetical protein